MERFYDIPHFVYFFYFFYKFTLCNKLCVYNLFYDPALFFYYTIIIDGWINHIKNDDQLTKFNNLQHMWLWWTAPRTIILRRNSLHNTQNHDIWFYLHHIHDGQLSRNIRDYDRRLCIQHSEPPINNLTINCVIVKFDY